MAGMYPDNSTESIFGDAVRWPGVDEETGKFTNGDFSDPLKPPSFIPAETVNLILDNLANLISALGGEPDNFSVGQLRDAVLARFDAASQSVEQGDADALAAAKAHADSAVAAEAAARRQGDADALAAAKAHADEAASAEAAARRQGDADTLAQAGQMVLDAQLATNTWLPSAETAADLPTAASLDRNKNYLCKVLADPDQSSSIVWQLAAGETEWAPFAPIGFVPIATEQAPGIVRSSENDGEASVNPYTGAVTADARLPVAGDLGRLFQGEEWDVFFRAAVPELGALTGLPWPLQIAGGPSDIFVDGVELNGARAFRVRAIQSWTGIDLICTDGSGADGRIPFREGDRITVRIESEGANQFILNADNGGWDQLAFAETGAGGGAVSLVHTVSESSLGRISANNPPGARIRGNAAGAVFFITEILVERGARRRFSEIMHRTAREVGRAFLGLRGFAAVGVTNGDNHEEPQILAGSSVELNGGLWEMPATMPIRAIGELPEDAFVHCYMRQASASACEFVWRGNTDSTPDGADTPIWDAVKNGWYHKTLNERCILTAFRGMFQQHAWAPRRLVWLSKTLRTKRKATPASLIMRESGINFLTTGVWPVPAQASRYCEPCYLRCILFSADGSVLPGLGEASDVFVDMPGDLVLRSGNNSDGYQSGVDGWYQGAVGNIGQVSLNGFRIAGLVSGVGGNPGNRLVPCDVRIV